MNQLLMTLVENFTKTPFNISVDETLLTKVGYPNSLLENGADYEWLWRVALLCEFDIISENDIKLEIIWDNADNISNNSKLEEFKIRSFIIGEFSHSLRYLNLFDSLITKILSLSTSDSCMNYLESMIVHTDSFYNLYTKINLYIILKGDYICGDVLPCFSNELSNALRLQGQPTLEVDMNVLPLNENDINRYNEKWYLLSSINPTALIGFQTLLFTNQLSNGKLIGNLFACNKYQFIFDHPANVCYMLIQPIKNYYVFSLDRNYTTFINNYCDNVKKAFTIPPAGTASDLIQEKKYDISFIGKFYDYKDLYASIESLPSDLKSFSYELLDYMLSNPSIPYEEAFSYIASRNENFKNKTDNLSWVILLHKTRFVNTIVKFYFRELVIETILKSGITIHVFSNDWANSSLSKYKNLIIHEAVNYKDSLSIMQSSIISLNIMSWHKAGMTERIANAMLNNSVCLTDTSTYLEENFNDAKNIFLYHLTNLKTLPNLIQYILVQYKTDQLNIFLSNAQNIALSNHSWNSRAQDIIDIINTYDKSN